MFLIVVGATTASTLDFIGSYSLAVIILFPVLFLVVIPYISSKIVTGVPRVVRRLRKKRTAIRTYESLRAGTCMRTRRSLYRRITNIGSLSRTRRMIIHRTKRTTRTLLSNPATTAHAAHSACLISSTVHELHPLST